MQEQELFIRRMIYTLSIGILLVILLQYSLQNEAFYNRGLLLLSFIPFLSMLTLLELYNEVSIKILKIIFVIYLVYLSIILNFSRTIFSISFLLLLVGIMIFLMVKSSNNDRIANAIDKEEIVNTSYFIMYGQHIIFYIALLLNGINIFSFIIVIMHSAVFLYIKYFLLQRNLTKKGILRLNGKMDSIVSIIGELSIISVWAIMLCLIQLVEKFQVALFYMVMLVMIVLIYDVVIDPFFKIVMSKTRE